MEFLSALLLFALLELNNDFNFNMLIIFNQLVGLD